MPKADDRWTLFAGHEPSTSTKILPSLTSYFARSSASASESTLMAAWGGRALIARMASPLSGIATSDHSCSGDAPPGFGSTVTIFHPDVMRLRLPSSFVPTHQRASTRRPMRSVYTGTEATPEQVVAPDGQIVDILCGKQEQHITADIAYAVWQYWQATGDVDFLLDAGAEI